MGGTSFGHEHTSGWRPRIWTPHVEQLQPAKQASDSIGGYGWRSARAEPFSMHENREVLGRRREGGPKDIAEVPKEQETGASETNG